MGSTRKRTIPLADVVADSIWDQEFDVGPNGYPVDLSPEDLVMCGIMRLVQLAETAADRDNRVIEVLWKICKKLDGARAPDSKAERERRESESRARAWAAYKKAGGTEELTPGADTLSLDAKLHDYKFSIRVRKCFIRENIVAVADLLTKSGDDLLLSKNFGYGSLHEVRTFLAKHGLALKGDPRPQPPEA